MKNKMVTTTDYVTEWKAGNYYFVLDKLLEYWQNEDIDKNAKLVWFMRLGQEMWKALNRRLGYGGYEWFINEFETLIENQNAAKS